MGGWERERERERLWVYCQLPFRTIAFGTLCQLHFFQRLPSAICIAIRIFNECGSKWCESKRVCGIRWTEKKAKYFLSIFVLSIFARDLVVYICLHRSASSTTQHSTGTPPHARLESWEGLQRAGLICFIELFSHAQLASSRFGRQEMNKARRRANSPASDGQHFIRKKKLHQNTMGANERKV